MAKNSRVVIRSRRAGLDDRFDCGFDGCRSGSDPSGSIGVQAGGLQLGPPFQMTGAIANGFHISGECRGNKHPRLVHPDQIEQPPIFLSRPLASTMPGHLATLFSFPA
jgi:hypothetical protein